MPVPPGQPSGVCYLLQEDPELAEALAPSVRATAMDTIVLGELRLATGPWRNRRVAAMDVLRPPYQQGWGRVRSDGVVIPLRLTHAVLSDLVAARRPTVTSALSDLSRRGEVRSVPEGWLLSGEPPSSARPGVNPRVA